MSANSPSDAHLFMAKETIPAISFDHQRAAAEERRRAFPYRFPRDSRQLGGKYSVAENARRLLRFFYFERRLMQALGAWTLSIPEFEVKLETGRHIFYHADAAGFSASGSTSRRSVCGTLTASVIRKLTGLLKRC